MSGIEGDDAELDAMIAALSPAPLKAAVLERVAVKVAERAEAQYAAGEGPDGSEWPLNKNGRFPSLRRLTEGIEFHATEDGIAATGDDILRYHSPRSDAYSHLNRPTFPAEGQLSAPWAEAAEDAATEVLEELLGGR